MFNPLEPTMSHVPRSYFTPADRDTGMFEASRLRALSLRREAVDAFWHSAADRMRRIALWSIAAARTAISTRRDAAFKTHEGA